VLRALATGRLVALDSEAADDGAEAAVLAVAPLVAASGKVLGVVLIHEMPFMAFQAENLKGLAALTALLADMLEDHFVEARPNELLSLVPGLSLVPEPLLPERSLEAVPTASEELTETVSTEDGPGDDASAPGDDGFVGTRTGTHRRRSVAQSA
jgi:hypothetical protein